MLKNKPGLRGKAGKWLSVFMVSVILLGFAIAPVTAQEYHQMFYDEFGEKVTIEVGDHIYEHIYEPGIIEKVGNGEANVVDTAIDNLEGNLGISGLSDQEKIQEMNKRLIEELKSKGLNKPEIKNRFIYAIEQNLKELNFPGDARVTATRLVDEFLDPD
ncbi:MAG: hypothetical protein U9Q22_07680, partial [Candidatus Altiarchaeota archaeon]|nr:hypothetical protein [Candidatus Altiarchaeota archaeon]